MVGPLLWLPYSDDDAVHAACEVHRRLHQAVAAGDGTAARAAAEDHVAQMFAAVRDTAPRGQPRDRDASMES